MILLHNAQQLITPRSNGSFAVLENAAIASDENGNIAFVGTTEEGLAAYPDAEKIDATGKVLLPGFVDAHTHAIFGGDRCHEFLTRLRGATYQEIAASGGGIQYTVHATRNEPAENLFSTAWAHLETMVRHGTTTVEIKSGYGLSWEAERKMLRVAGELKREFPVDVIVTFLAAHDFPRDRSQEDYIREIVDEMIPEVAREKLAEFCDVFCDAGYYSPEQTRAICHAARDAGLKIKLHVDELADVHGAALAAELRATSADHLILANEDGIRAMANAGVIAVLLPGTSFALKVKNHAPARKMIDAGVRVALATDFNPGTCFSHSMQYVLQLSCLLYGLKPEEAITAATLHAAAAIDRDKILGSLEIGKQMDCLIFDVPEYGYLFYNLGINHLEAVLKRGKILWNRNQNQI